MLMGSWRVYIEGIEEKEGKRGRGTHGSIMEFGGFKDVPCISYANT